MQRLLGNSQLKRDLEARWHRLYRVAYSWCHDPQLSKDLVQDTVTKAIQNRHQLRDKQMLDSWLFKIMRNCWLDCCRRQKDLLSLDNAQLVTEMTPELLLGRESQIKKVRIAVSLLKPEFREVVTLVDLEQLSYKEVADILDVPIGTVMSRLCRARNQLKKALEESPADRHTAVVRRIK